MTSPIQYAGAEVRRGPKASTTACVRCRTKKKRCDQKLPRCRLCELAGVECYGYEPTARRQVPRSYVQSLEERVAYLESRLRDVGLQGQDKPCSQPTSSRPLQVSSESASLESRSDPATSPGTNSVPDITAKAALDTVRGLEQQRPRPETDFSTILLKDMMKTKTSSHRPRVRQDRSDQPSSDILGNLDTGPITLPTKDVAGTLVKEFFQSANLGMPLLHEPTFGQKLALVYHMPLTVNFAETHTTTESRISVFFVLEVFSIALLTMQKQDPTRIPTWLADRYHKGAVAALMEAGLPNDVEGVQALLLVGQFYYFHPTLWTVWNTVGAALRFAVELGLHQDPPPDEVEEFDALTLDIRRRTFWVAYSMDRNISIAKAIPSCLSDGAINVKFPSDLDDSLITSEGIGIASNESLVSGYKLVSFHFFRYRQIQSEMRTALYEKPSPPHAPVHLVQWQQQMRDRINRWYEDIPLSDKLNVRDRIVIETFELTYHTAIFHLYRPSPNNPSPSEPQWVAMTQSAMKIIQLHRKFFLEKKLTIYWQAVENISSAGHALMLGYVTSPQLREYIGFRSLESTLHACSSLLWGMVERFPAFQGKRDAFDVAVSSVLADLSTRGEMDESPIEAVAAGHGVISEHRQRSRLASCVGDSEPGSDAPPLPSACMDFGDLTMIWEATADLSGTPAPTWI